MPKVNLVATQRFGKIASSYAKIITRLTAGKTAFFKLKKINHERQTATNPSVKLHYSKKETQIKTSRKAVINVRK